MGIIRIEDHGRENHQVYIIDYFITNSLEDIEPCQARFEKISDHQSMETNIRMSVSL